MAIKADLPSNLAGERWDGVFPRARMEPTAESQLDRHGFTFFPWMHRPSGYAREIENVCTLLFAPYGFVCLGLDCDRWRAVNGTIGESGIVPARERSQPSAMASSKPLSI